MMLCCCFFLLTLFSIKMQSTIFFVSNMRTNAGVINFALLNFAVTQDLFNSKLTKVKGDEMKLFSIKIQSTIFFAFKSANKC